MTHQSCCTTSNELISGEVFLKKETFERVVNKWRAGSYSGSGKYMVRVGEHGQCSLYICCCSGARGCPWWFHIINIFIMFLGSVFGKEI